MNDISEVDVKEEYHRIAELRFLDQNGAEFRLISKQWSAYCVNSSKLLIDALLFLNTHNRRPKDADITLLRRSMRRNEFLETNQGIGVSKPDAQGGAFIIDGQNRCIANLQEGYPSIPLLIVVGIPRQAQAYVDAHARRSQTDILKLALEGRAQTLYTAIFNARNRFHMGSGSAALTILELAQLYFEDVENLARIVKSLGKYKRAPFVAALLDYSIRSSLENCLELAQQISTGAMIDKDSPAWRARDMLDRLKKGSSGGGVEQLSLYRKTISICVAHWRGELLTQVRETTNWPTLTGMPGKRKR